MGKARPSFDAIDWLLVAAIIGLSAVLLAELSKPAVAAWRNRPRAGVQVCQQYVTKIGEGNDAVEMGVDYLLYLPRNHGRSTQWPLLIFLHGSGERGHDLEIVRHGGLPGEVEKAIAGKADAKLCKQILDEFVFVAPQCPQNSSWTPELVIALIEHICNMLPIDRDRVCLTGFSMGGFGTWQTACEYPDRFAAIVPISGGGGGGDVQQAERLKNLPIWAFHRAKDETVPLIASQAMVDAVRKCGGHVEFTVYPEARTWHL